MFQNQMQTSNKKNQDQDTLPFMLDTLKEKQFIYAEEL